jgi:MFS family permease
VSSRLIVALCISVWSATFSFGAFPPLLADIARSVSLSDQELGAVAGTFGFARMVSDIPIGLFIARYLRWALAVGPLLLVTGVLCLSAATSVPMLLLGRGIMGVAGAISMVAGLTSILRFQGPQRLGAALNAFEFSAMIGMLGGVTVISALPTSLPWNQALLVACVPQLVAVAMIPVVIASLPRDSDEPSLTTESTSFGARRPRPFPFGVILAFVAGGTIAIAYATIEQFVLPVRGSREFGLDRSGIARLLMIAQICDITLLLPFGVLADRFGPGRILQVVLTAQAAGLLLTAFGGLPSVMVGVVCYGVGMAGWMLPLGVLRRGTEPKDVAWRTAVYRVCVDGGMFLGPFASGFLAHQVGLLPATVAAVLVLLVVLMRGR